MFISTLSTADGFKLTLPDGEEIQINLMRTAGKDRIDSWRFGTDKAGFTSRY